MRLNLDSLVHQPAVVEDTMVQRDAADMVGDMEVAWVEGAVVGKSMSPTFVQPLSYRCSHPQGTSY